VLLLYQSTCGGRRWIGSAVSGGGVDTWRQSGHVWATRIIKVNCAAWESLKIAWTRLGIVIDSYSWIYEQPANPTTVYEQTVSRSISRVHENYSSRFSTIVSIHGCRSTNPPFTG
jgi:hypothetical protein